MAGDFIGLTNKQDGDQVIDGIGGRQTKPVGETSIFHNEALDGVPRQEDLFAIRFLGQTAQIEKLKDMIKSQIASTEFSIVPDIPESEDREPTDRELQAAQNAEEFFRGNYNDNNTSIDALHGQLLDDILDMNSGVLELVPDSQGNLKKMIPRDGLTFTINEDKTGELPPPDSEEPAYYQFSLASRAKQFFRADRQGIDINELRDQLGGLNFTQIFNREQKKFSRDQIVWFSEPQNAKTHTPYGRGRTQKVKMLAETMINGDNHRNRFFLDNEFHKGFMQVDPGTSQEQVKNIRKRFSQNAGDEFEMQVIGGENLDWVSIDPEPEKMQFLESQKWYTKEVLRGYGLNDVEAGILENANKGISDNAKEQIFRRVTGPILDMFEKRWNNQVLPFMAEYKAVDVPLKFRYEPENRFMESLENDIITEELDNGTMTVNEARQRKNEQGFGELGNVPKSVLEKYAQENPSFVIEELTDLEDVPSGNGGGGGLFQAVEADEEQLEEERKKSGESGSPEKQDFFLNIDSYREAFKHRDKILEHTKDALRNERGFKDVPGIVEHKESMREDVAEVFNSIDLEAAIEQSFPDDSQENGVLINADKIVDNINFRDRLASVLESNNITALEMSAEHNKQDIEQETEERLTIPSETKVEISFDVTNTLTADLIREQAFDSATTIEGTVKDRLKNELLDGANKGEGIPDIRERIQNTVNDISKNHAELVARTETLSSSRKGSQALAESTDLVGGKEWLATSDSRTREWHDTMDGIVVNKDDVFTVPRTGSDDQPSNYPRTARVVGEDQPFNCFDNKTEVLTENGWKLFRNVEKDERVYTFNMETQGLELQKTTGYIEKEVDEILRYEGESVSIGATPEHDMIVTYGKEPKKRTLGDIKENNSSYVNIPNQTKGLIGKHPETYTLEKEYSEHKYHTDVSREEWGEKEIPIETWAEFLGVYLGDGFTCISDKGYSTRIAATKERKQEHAKELLDKMGYDYYVTDTVVIVENKQLALETEELSKGANNKTVPDYVFEWDRELIDIFLDGYTSTDGNVTEYGSRRIWTTSEEMTDQLQQLFILTGKDASIIKQERDKVDVMGKECDAQDLYCIQERKRENKSISQRENDIEEVDYDGKVRCLETPNGTLMVRRNKKAIIAGNCRCSQAPVLAEDMPDSPQQLEAEFDGVNVDLGVTKRQFEVWKEHGQERESFEKFWESKTEKMSKTEIADKFNMSKTTVYKWS